MTDQLWQGCVKYQIPTGQDFPTAMKAAADKFYTERGTWPTVIWGTPDAIEYQYDCQVVKLGDKCAVLVIVSTVIDSPQDEIWLTNDLRVPDEITLVV
jgi:hypothetical protein